MANTVYTSSIKFINDVCQKPSDGLVSYPGHSLVRKSYASAEM